MESLKPTELLEFRPNALQEIRKMYGLESPGSMDDAVNILEEWVKRQDHFIKKDFGREYLERVIIRAKGSVERSKERLDKLCSARSLMPDYFVNCKITDLADVENVKQAFLPKPTKDHYRVYMLNNFCQNMNNDFFKHFYIQLIYYFEYALRYEYAAGIIFIADYRKANILSMTKNLDIVQLQQIYNILTSCYGLRIKGIHLISNSKLIETFVVILKQILSQKIGARVQVHNSLESLHQHVEKEILPLDYGGEAKPLIELHDRSMEILTSKDHMEYMKIANAAGTDEKYRPTYKFNEQCMGLPGTFRSLRVD